MARQNVNFIFILLFDSVLARNEIITELVEANLIAKCVSLMFMSCFILLATE